jgi:hypothetical protein
LILLGLSPASVAYPLETPAMLFHQLAELNLEGIYGFKERLNSIRLPRHALVVDVGAEVFQHLI